MFSNTNQLPRNKTCYEIISQCLALYRLPMVPTMNEAYTTETYHGVSDNGGNTVLIVDWTDYTMTLFWSAEH